MKYKDETTKVFTYNNLNEFPLFKIIEEDMDVKWLMDSPEFYIDTVKDYLHEQVLNQINT